MVFGLSSKLRNNFGTQKIKDFFVFKKNGSCLRDEGRERQGHKGNWFCSNNCKDEFEKKIKEQKPIRSCCH